jgi:hypothetical protein
MIRAKTQNGNGESSDLIAELSDIARRKRRTANHIERAIANWYKRRGVTDSIPRFKVREVGRDE